MLGRLRKQQQGLVRTVLALFVVGCLNLIIQSCLMAATLNDCHDSTIQSPPANSGSQNIDCSHCPINERAVDNHEKAPLYMCASVAACNGDDQQSVIVTAEQKLKPLAVPGSSIWQNLAEAPAYKYQRRSSIGPPPQSLHIHYCCFLI